MVSVRKVKLYPRIFPHKRCPACKKMASKTDWRPHGYDPLLREYKCPFNHLFYRQLTKWEVEIEQYHKARSKQK